MSEETNGDGLPQVAFDYIKGQFFRVVHVDGAIGGLTPNGGLHLSLFSERPPIPRKEVRQLNRDGTLGAPLPEKTEVRDAIVREVEVDLIMSLPVAEALAVWLKERVEAMHLRMSLESRAVERPE